MIPKHRTLGRVALALASLLAWSSVLLFSDKEESLASGAAATSSFGYLPLVANHQPLTPDPTATVAATAAGTPTLFPTPTTSTSYSYYLTGDPANVTPPTEAGLMLMGGGPDVDAAFNWLIQKSGGGDVVVLRASGSDGYNSYIYSDLGGVNSVETVVLHHRSAANDPFVVSTVQNADALFVAGGDQWDYVTRWKETALEDAIHTLVAQDVPIGGTSAGLVILGEFLFSAENGTVYSYEALADPYNQYMRLESDFLVLPHLDKTITDSHFYERDRMGRLIAFLARIVQDGWAAEARGIGINEETAVLIEADGSALLVGSGAAYFLRTPGPPQVCQPNTPVTFLNIDVYRIFAGQTFNLVTWAGVGGTPYEISAMDGVLTSTQLGGGIY